MKNKMKHILAMLLALCLFAETPLTAIPVLAEGTDEVTVTEEQLTNEIPAEQTTDIREHIFYAFAEAKLPIYSMSMAGKSLEDVFLELTQQTGGEI